MSGNSTRLGVGLAQGSMSGPIAAGLIATFVIGVMLGTLTGQIAKEAKTSRRARLGDHLPLGGGLSRCGGGAAWRGRVHGPGHGR